MKSAKPALLALSVVYTGIAIQISSSQATVHPAAPGIKMDAVAATQPATQSVAGVKIDNFNFSPKELTVSVGTTVTWQNADDVPHTATSKDDPQTFDSGAIDTDEKYSFTFKKAGKYAYYCKVHPHMTGVVIVK